jgi:uncharacterized protein (DUF58 family)
LAFTALILMVGVGAFASANNLLFLLLAAMLATMLVSGLVSRLSLAGLEVKLLLPEHVFAKQRLPARLQLVNLKQWMPSFSILLGSSDTEESPLRIYFPILPGGAALEAMTTVFFKTRGLHGDTQYQFTTRFPFGFTERRLQVRLRREVLVYPSITAKEGFEDLFFSLAGELDAHSRGIGQDFYRIRPYEMTESARHLDWKATAHTGDLQIREFAREEDTLVEIFLDRCIGAQDKPWLEAAIECCAFLCWKLAGRNARLRFVSQQADIRVPEDGDVYTILKFLAKAEPVTGRAHTYPHEATSFQIVFSLDAKRAQEDGWTGARFLDERVLSAGNGSDAAVEQAGRKPGAGAKFSDGGR